MPTPDLQIESDSHSLRAWLSGGARAGSLPEAGVTAIVHGELHDDTGGDPRRVVEAYLREGREFARSLNGTFAVVVFDARAGRVLVVTDRFSGRRVFLSSEGGRAWITSSLGAQPTADRTLDPIAVAWALTSGAAYNRRTLFEGVRVLDPGAVTELTPGGWQSTSYWTFGPIREDNGLDAEEAEAELFRQMVRAVERRVDSGRDLHLSLSGGFDSTALAAILVRELGVRDLSTFTYALGTPDEKSDAHVASRSARSLGLEHRVVQSYGGDLLEHCRLNALFGEGLAYPCDEVDAWVALAGTLGPNPVVFTGEEEFGFWIMDSGPPRSAFEYARMRLLQLVAPLAATLEPGVLGAMRRGLEADRDEIWARIGKPLNKSDAVFRISADQRKTHIYLAWREAFCSRVATVRTPWFDSELLDFVETLPLRLRSGRRLYEDMLTRRYPTLLGGDRPEIEGYYPDLRAEYCVHEAALRDWIETTPSRLDALVGPDFGLWLLRKETRRWARAAARGGRLLSGVSRRMSSGAASDPFLAETPLLRRWIILRMALAE